MFSILLDLHFWQQLKMLGGGSAGRCIELGVFLAWSHSFSVWGIFILRSAIFDEIQTANKAHAGKQEDGAVGKGRHMMIIAGDLLHLGQALASRSTGS